MKKKTLINLTAVFLLLVCFGISKKTFASYLYEFEFDAITLSDGAYFSADEFSFSSDALIGPPLTPSGSSTPFIDSVNFASALTLNGYSFNSVDYAGSGWSCPSELPNLFSLGFDTPEDWSVGDGQIATWYVSVLFPEGTYGPGVYSNDRFGRGIMYADPEHPSISYHYTTGTLTITDLDSPPVPEPATIMLFGIGLLGLAGVSRRKN